MAAGAEEKIWLKVGDGTGVSGIPGRKVSGSLGSTGLDVGKPKAPDVPEIAGKGIKGKSNLVEPTQEGLDAIKKHLSGDMQADFNDAMIARVEKILKEGGKLEDPDAEFY